MVWRAQEVMRVFNGVVNEAMAVAETAMNNILELVEIAEKIGPLPQPTLEWPQRRSLSRSVTREAQEIEQARPI